MKRPEEILAPLEEAVLTKQNTLIDQKTLLEDRGGILRSDRLGLKVNVIEKCKSYSNNSGYRYRSDACDDPTTFRRSGRTSTCSASGRGTVRRIKTVLFWLLVAIFVDTRMQVSARLPDLNDNDIKRIHKEPRYDTAYACDGKILKIGCGEGTVIHLIRANYGRFSITICNDHGNTDWSVNCMSTRSLRVLHTRCSMQPNCSIMASTHLFGDPCSNTYKYLEAHYQCVPASSTSPTNRPTPPWLISSQPNVWRSTVAPVPKSPIQTQQEKKKPTVITPPTFRPHITLPPEVQLGNIGTKKTTAKVPDSSSERDPPETVLDDIPEAEEEMPKVADPDHKPKIEKPKKDEDVSSATDETLQWPPKDEDTDPTTSVHGPSKDVRPEDEEDFDKSYTTNMTPPLGRRAYCPQVFSRGLHWNWTLAGSYAVQPCPGGAMGLARWKCTFVSTQYEEEDRLRRRGTGLQSGENYHDLGLDQPNDKQLQLMRRISSDALLKGRDGDPAESVIDYRSSSAPPYTQTSHSAPTTDDMTHSDSTAEWHGSTPDLSECRSVWVNSLEARVREGESLLSVSNDLAQVTSSKMLYGGDMMTTTNIMKKLALRMSQNTFSDSKQRESLVNEMVLAVIKTGSNLLEESQRPSWMDLNSDVQNRVASALLTQLEENAFLLAEAYNREKTVLQIVKNICLAVKVLEVKNVEEQEFPNKVTQDQWKISEDTITIPKSALLENHHMELVRIVFFAYNRLEEILPATYGKNPQFAAYADPAVASTTTINSDREKKNITRVVNSKVISASLGTGRHIQLSDNVKLVMKHLRTENVTNPTCVYWDYTLHGWSSEGCQVEWSNATHTGCSCSHLTNFAILMDVCGVSLSAQHELALRLLTFIGCAISSVALFAAIVIFQCFRNMKSDRALIHKNLCFCLLIAEVVFMWGIDQTQERILCGIIAGVLHYFFLAAFAWMFIEGLHLYAMLVEVFEPEKTRVRWYVVGAYSVPALVVLVAASLNPGGYGTSRYCWLTTDHLFHMSFVGPVAVVLLANWVCLSMVIYMMCHHSTVSIKAKENSKMYKLKVWINSSVVLAFLLGLTWTFGLLYLNEQTAAMAYAFTILNSLQGLFIFIFHCLQNEIFQKECVRLCRRHRWLSCCLALAGPTAPPSSTNHVDTRAGSVKSRRYHQNTADTEDVVDPRDVTNTSSKYHPGNTATLPNHDTLARQMVQHNHVHSPHSECDLPLSAGSPRHLIRDEESPLHHPLGYQTTRSYNHDFRNPHVFMSQNSPGSQEMIYRKQFKDDNRRKYHNHYGSQNINHTYSEIASQQGRIYRAGSEEFRVIRDDPVYEEIERNETLMSDVSDDNSGPDNSRQTPGLHGSSNSKFCGDHRPLISYSPGDRHHLEHEHYGKYGKWDSIERSYDPRNPYESGRLMHQQQYHPPQENNMRALAAVLNGESVVCHLEPHSAYDTYQPPPTNQRTLSQPSF